MAIHTHSAVINTTPLTGQFTVVDSRFSGNGILSRHGSYAGYTMSMYNKTDANLHIDATHTHGVSVAASGNNQGHNILQPYIVVYRYRRIY